MGEGSTCLCFPCHESACAFSTHMIPSCFMLNAPFGVLVLWRSEILQQRASSREWVYGGFGAFGAGAGNGARVRWCNGDGSTRLCSLHRSVSVPPLLTSSPVALYLNAPVDAVSLWQAWMKRQRMSSKQRVCDGFQVFRARAGDVMMILCAFCKAVDRERGDGSTHISNLQDLTVLSIRPTPFHSELARLIAPSACGRRTAWSLVLRFTIPHQLYPLPTSII